MIIELDKEDMVRLLNQFKLFEGYKIVRFWRHSNNKKFKIELNLKKVKEASDGK